MKTKEKFELLYQKIEDRPFTSAIIVAAGNSIRMGKPKIFLDICGVPVITRSMLALQNAACVDEIVVAAKEADLSAITGLADFYRISKFRIAVTGGETRTESVINGTTAINKKAEYIMVHDAARPLVRPKRVDALCEMAYIKNAATLAVYAKDTIKRVDPHGKILETLPREQLMCVQTPQVFKSDIFLPAIKKAAEQHLVFTDDCSLLESMGETVYALAGDYDNIKITTPEDVAIAESILASNN